MFIGRYFIFKTKKCSNDINDFYFQNMLCEFKYLKKKISKPRSAQLIFKNFYFQNMLFELKYLKIRCTYKYLMDGF